MRYIYFLIALFFITHTSFSQGHADSTTCMVEDYIIQEKLDSALLLIPKLKRSDYTSILEKIAQNKNFNYKEQLTFIKSTQSRIKPDNEGIKKYFESNLHEPNTSESINKDYAYLRFIQISNLRNDNEISEATTLNDEFESYISQFDTNEIEVKRALIYHKIHSVVVKTILMKGEESENLGLEILKLATAISDTNLMCAAYYNLYTVYQVIRDLNKSIEVAEKAKELDEKQKIKSIYYYDNLFLLMDSYMFKGDHLNEVGELLRTLYQDEKIRPKSYEMIARYLRKIIDDEVEKASIFEMLGVEGIVEFSDKANRETEGIIYEYDQYHFYNASAFTLHDYGEHDLALRTLMKAVLLTRKIYSEDLSKSLAKSETSQIRKEKELEVAYEKEQTKLYSLIAILIGFLFVISIVAFIRKQKQASLLAEKKQEVETALHEKQLLLKEVHHRVKNNFQIISSLLELQSKGIEDEKAKELAQEGKNRVKSMALIHQKLYQNDDLLIYFDEYIDKLIKEITSMYGPDKEVEISINASKTAFDIDTAIPLGLIVNELVTNAFKYGLGESKSRINISIQEEKEGDYKLEIQDNGKGLPDDFDLSNAKSMGLRLVKSLSKQLHGSVSYSNNNGARFRVFFKNTLARTMVE